MRASILVLIRVRLPFDSRQLCSPYPLLGYGVAIGQNIGWGFVNWTMVIRDWHSEMSRYMYGMTPNYQKIGQYTQVKASGARCRMNT